MKFICPRDDLLKVVNAGNIATESRGGISILANVLLEVKEVGKSQTLWVRANNINMSLEATLLAEVQAVGAITVSQNKFCSVLKECPEGDVFVELQEGNRLLIRPSESKRHVKASMRGIVHDEFPEMPEVPDERQVIPIDKRHYRRMVQKTIFAVSNTSTQYTLNGLFMEYKDDLLTFVGIDGRRLALFKASIPKNEHPDFEAIIPPEFLMHILRLLGDDGDMSLMFGDNRLFISFDDMHFSTTILEGKFPNYMMFIPKEYEGSVLLRTHELVSAIDFVSTLVDEESNKTIWDFTKTALKLCVKNTDHGESEENLAIHYEGKPYRMGLNCKLIGEILKHIDTEELVFRFNADLAPILVKEKGRDEYYFIIMPMKLDDVSSDAGETEGT